MRFLPFFLAACVAHSSAMGAEFCSRQEAVSSFGEWISPGPTIRASGPNWSQPIKVTPDGFHAASMRLAIRVAQADASSAWHVVVRDPTMRPVATLGPSDFLGRDGKLSRKRWTARLHARSARIDLLATPGSKTEIEVSDIVAYPAESSDVHLFSVVGDAPAWKPLYTDEQSDSAKRAGDVLAMLTASTENQQGDRLSWCCSGVMLSPSLLLTNWHCGGHPGLGDAKFYWNGSVLDSMLVDLRWDWDPTNPDSGATSVSRQFGALSLLAQDRRLDYALIRLSPTIGVGGSTGEPVSARIQAAAPEVEDKVFLLHHAKCSPKLISRKCSVRSANYPSWWSPPGQDGGTPDLTHDCDSEPGASGAPLFNGSGALIALHHTGFDRDENCNAIGSRVNKAVKIGEILKHIELMAPSASKEIEAVQYSR